MVTIEAATSADIDHVTDRWVELARDQRDHGSHLLAEENRGAVRDAVARHVIENDLLVARDEGIVGFVMFELETGLYRHSTARGIVQNIYVEPASRNEGVGSALLAAAEEKLRERGAEVLALEVLARNENARRLYENRGYEPHRIEMEKSDENDNHSKE
ncbi:GCN5-related N-acetyltransferase [Haladaptatus paucihalophilus DX253]|uniref:Acetyltransferase (GNAT) family protein n=1 Tax=Haladaptatus paucihalophilus DX253 TaxID=797209 RepID=E7QQ17_HALPU|nr:GNAT family N-acetyltransferase [Haladaptatus paucihalophilus]EFW93081.1 GCN5-related N-acetyltransferase [Haladaptatus paucihalophilus DX253]SHK44109.1 Acetyltransferase (GNAT) family protein [Haladaptatus paucihalophilus DX253]